MRRIANHTMAVACVFGFAWVLLGALGAHQFAGSLQEGSRHLFETAGKYHIVHALALLCCGFLMRERVGLAIRIAALGFFLGLILFCGSLYVVALGGPANLVKMTPVGGTLFMVAWLSMALGVW